MCIFIQYHVHNKGNMYIRGYATSWWPVQPQAYRRLHTDSSHMHRRMENPRLKCTANNNVAQDKVHSEPRSVCKHLLSVCISIRRAVWYGCAFQNLPAVNSNLSSWMWIRLGKLYFIIIIIHLFVLTTHRHQSKDWLPVWCISSRPSASWGRQKKEENSVVGHGQQ